MLIGDCQLEIVLVVLPIALLWLAENRLQWVTFMQAVVVDEVALL